MHEELADFHRLRWVTDMYIHTQHIHIHVICLQPLQGTPPVSRTEDARLKEEEACHVKGERLARLDCGRDEA